MGAFGYPFYREQLRDRRRRLETAVSAAPEPDHSLRRLLGEVDSALERIESGTFGLCDACHDPIEPERLMADPLVRVCLDHLTDSERRELERDLELAARIQNGLLPKNDLRSGGWELNYHYEAAGPVSGDYCDVLTPDGEAGLLFLVGDVSGKGVAASLLMSQLHAIVRTLAGTGAPLPQVMEQANRVFCENTPSSHYATLVCGTALESGEMEIANAGHCRPLLVRPGNTQMLEPAGLPIGLFCNSEYPTQRIRVALGESLLLHTDGLVEARNMAGLEYGTDRLSALAAGLCPRSARELTAAVVADVRSFARGMPRQDDLTVVTIRRQEQHAP